MNRDDFWWMGMIRKDVCNWTPWILSNVIDTLLLLERDIRRRREGVTRALRCWTAIWRFAGGWGVRRGRGLFQHGGRGAV